MSEERDEVDLFIRRQRWRGVARVMAVAALAGAGYVGYRNMPVEISRALVAAPLPPVDAPSQLFNAAPEDAARSAELDPYRLLFSRTFPAWTDELRKYRKLKVTNPAEADEAALAAARTALLDAVASDEALRTPVTGLIDVAENAMTQRSGEVVQRLADLNAVLQNRRLPFVAAGIVVQQDQVPTLRVRFHELVSEDALRVGDTPVKVRFLDRLDLTDLDRDPDPLPAAGATPTVYTRAVSATVNSSLFGALHPAGGWQLTRTLAPSPDLKALEASLARGVEQEWKAALESAPAGARDALVTVSEAVSRRNEAYRAINLRDPGRPVMVQPSSVTLGWSGHAWLARMQPYAIKGLVRLTLEDMERLRSWDRELETLAPAAAPAIRTVLKTELRSAALAEARRVSLRGERPAPEPLVARLGDEEGKNADAWLGGRLTQVVEAGDLCMTRVAMLTGDAVESNPVSQAAAQLALERLAKPALKGRPLNAATLKEAVDSLTALSCRELSDRATAVYQELYGPYTAVVDAADTVADVSGPASAERLR